MQAVFRKFEHIAALLVVFNLIASVEHVQAAWVPDDYDVQITADSGHMAA